MSGGPPCSPERERKRGRELARCPVIEAQHTGARLPDRSDRRRIAASE